MIFLSLIAYSILGFFIDIKQMKKKIKNYLLDVPSGDNFIIIQRSSMNRSDIASSISHEIYHYLDKLIGVDVDYSQKSNLSKFIDKRIVDKNSAIKKLSIILFGELPSKETMNLLEDIHKDVLINKDYFSEDEEIFARYKTLKDDMVSKHILSDINDKITLSKIVEFLSKCSTSERIGNFTFIFYLDLSKLDELDKIL